MNRECEETSAEKTRSDCLWTRGLHVATQYTATGCLWEAKEQAERSVLVGCAMGSEKRWQHFSDLKKKLFLVVRAGIRASSFRDHRARLGCKSARLVRPCRRRLVGRCIGGFERCSPHIKELVSLCQTLGNEFSHQLFCIIAV